MSLDNNDEHEKKQWASSQILDHPIVQRDFSGQAVGAWPSDDCIAILSVEDENTVVLRDLYTLEKSRRSGSATNKMNMICSRLDGFELNCQLEVMQFEFMNQQDAESYVDYASEAERRSTPVQMQSHWLVPFFKSFGFELMESVTNSDDSSLTMFRSFKRVKVPKGQGK